MSTRYRNLLIATASAAGALLITFAASPAAAEGDCTAVAGVEAGNCSQASTTSTTAPASSGPTVDSAGAARLVELANAERRAAGVGELVVRADVASIALDHSRAMAADGNLRHNDAYFAPAMRQQLKAKMLGENVAMNPSVDDAHRRLMNSAGHRANLLDGRFSVVGMAVVRDANGQLWITQDFVQPAAAAATAAPAAPRAARTARTARAGAGAPGAGAAADAGAGGGSGEVAASPEPAAEAAPPEAEDVVLAGRIDAGARLASSSAGSGDSALILIGCLISLLAVAATNRVITRRLPG